MVFRVGMDNEKVDRNPLSKVRRKQEANDRVRYLTPEEETQLAKVLEKDFPDYLPIFLLSANTGMRMSEQFRSKVGDYDTKTRMLTVHQKKDPNKPMVRYVPLGRVGAAAHEQLAKGKKSGAFLCLNSEGSQMTDVTYWFNPSLKKAGILDYHWHDNRHTACSRWVMGGVPLAAVASYVGHSTIQMTMRYSHLMPGANQKATDVMDAFYSAVDNTVNGTATRTATGTSEQMKMGGG